VVTEHYSHMKEIRKSRYGRSEEVRADIDFVVNTGAELHLKIHERLRFRRSPFLAFRGIVSPRADIPIPRVLYLLSTVDSRVIVFFQRDLKLACPVCMG
jgi:hypothetical protein